MTTLEQHLHAETARAAASHLADDFRATVHPGSVHLVTTGAADSGGPTSPDRSNLDRGAMLDLLDWEFALHRTITASDFRFDEASITATCFAENDLSRLVEFPGWETTVTWTFDGRGKIAGQVIAPARGAPDFRNWLAPAINWLRQHRPADLDWLAPDGLPPTAGNLSPRAAKRWVEVLTEWRGATDRRPIELHAPLKPAADAAR